MEKAVFLRVSLGTALSSLGAHSERKENEPSGKRILSFKSEPPNFKLIIQLKQRAKLTFGYLKWKTVKCQEKLREL